MAVLTAIFRPFRDIVMSEDDIYMEVEDIMCDQGILQLNVDFQTRSSSIAVSAA